jgi:hypothetical protein
VLVDIGTDKGIDGFWRGGNSFDGHNQQTRTARLGSPFRLPKATHPYRSTGVLSAKGHLSGQMSRSCGDRNRDLFIQSGSHTGNCYRCTHKCSTSIKTSVLCFRDVKALPKSADVFGQEKALKHAQEQETGSVNEGMDIIKLLADYVLAAVFLVLYVRSQTELVKTHQIVAEQRRDENREMRTLLFELARRGVTGERPFHEFTNQNVPSPDN